MTRGNAEFHRGSCIHFTLHRHAYDGLRPIERRALSVESGGIREPMQTYERARRVILVSNNNPEVAVLQDIERTANYAVVRRQTA